MELKGEFKNTSCAKSACVLRWYLSQETSMFETVFTMINISCRGVVERGEGVLRVGDVAHPNRLLRTTLLSVYHTLAMGD